MLHISAINGDLDQLRRVIESGRVHIDCVDKVSASFYSDIHVCSSNDVAKCVFNSLQILKPVMNQWPQDPAEMEAWIEPY